MFYHNFKYSFKTLFRNKTLIFWTFAFPIILGTFFNMAFSNIENSEALAIIDIAVVQNEEFEENEILKTALEELSKEDNEERMFNTKYVKSEEASEMLQNDEITGYLVMEENGPKVVVKQNGIEETVFQYVIEEILQQEEIIKNIISKKAEDYQKELIKQMQPAGSEVSTWNMPNQDMTAFYEKLAKEVQDLVQTKEASIKDTSSSNLSYTMIEFYTLIAMFCLYSGILGLVSINQNLANMTSQGKRIAVSPTSKAKVILSSVLASYIVSLIGLALLFVYTIFVLKVDYGTNLPLIILLGMVGTLAGLSLGITIGTCLKTTENTKTGILLAITMFGCFLSGMMGITMKYLVDKNMPIINKVNPASMITDGFYALYYYSSSLDRYYFNIVSLLIFSAILISISFFQLRRQTYDSI